MKKLFTLITLLFVGVLYSQNSFTLYHFNAEDGGERAIANLATEFWGDAKFNSGGVQIERIGMGDNPWSHRIIFFGELGNRGRVEGDVEKYEWGLFRQRLNDYVKEWGPGYAGRFLSYAGGQPKDYPTIQIYEFTPKDAQAFQKAHEKLVKSTSKTRGDRPVAFGSFDIGGGGASHWIAIGSSDFDDLMDQKVKAEKNNSKEWAEWWKTNGGFENKGNFVIRVLATFGSL